MKDTGASFDGLVVTKEVAQMEVTVEVKNNVLSLLSELKDEVSEEELEDLKEMEDQEQKPAVQKDSGEVQCEVCGALRSSGAGLIRHYLKYHSELATRCPHCKGKPTWLVPQTKAAHMAWHEGLASKHKANGMDDEVDCLTCGARVRVERIHGHYGKKHKGQGGDNRVNCEWKDCSYRIYAELMPLHFGPWCC